VPYDRPAAEIPAEVVELARSGNRVEAMRLYRDLMNASVEEAREALRKI
jgi:hypothetical protein